MYTKKFASLGIQASIDEIFGSSYAAAFYLKRHFEMQPGQRLYIIGEKGLAHEVRMHQCLLEVLTTMQLDSEGIPWTGGPVRLHRLI
jgi:ribonucleotide monophosphatase NagD (HAD superfamily)